MVGGNGVSGLVVGGIGSGGPHCILGVRLKFIERLRLV
jgi:hypothetical protein